MWLAETSEAPQLHPPKPTATRAILAPLMARPPLEVSTPRSLAPPTALGGGARSAGWATGAKRPRRSIGRSEAQMDEKTACQMASSG